MRFAALLLLPAWCSAQKIGTSVKEEHPKLTIHSCTNKEGCSPEERAIVIDNNWRWVHQAGKYVNCYDGDKWSSSLCPDVKTCNAPQRSSL